MKWYWKYVERLEEPATDNMALGSAVGTTSLTNLQHRIDHEQQPMPLGDVLDVYAQEFQWAFHDEGEVIMSEPEDKIKDQGASLVRLWHTERQHMLTPAAVEQEIVLRPPGASWKFKCYLDLVDDQGVVRDLKTSKNGISLDDARKDPQVDAYLAAKMLAGERHDTFVYEVLRKTKVPGVEQVPTSRSELRLINYLRRVEQSAQEIAWRWETGNWTGAPSHAFWCSSKQCGFFPFCEYGGMA